MKENPQHTDGPVVRLDGCPPLSGLPERDLPKQPPQHLAHPTPHHAAGNPLADLASLDRVDVAEESGEGVWSSPRFVIHLDSRKAIELL